MKPRGTLGRTGWTILDQGISSFSNVLVVVVTARAVSAGDFGRFSLALTAYSVVVGLCRAATGEPLLVVASGQVAHRDDARVLGAATVAGLVGGALLGTAALLGGGELAWILAISLVGLLAQDATRYVLIARGRPSLAAAADATWVVTVLTAFVLAAPDAVGSYLGLWAGAGALSAVVGIALVGTRPRVVEAAGWLREHRVLIRRFVAEFAFLSGASQLVVLLVGFRTSAADAGALRAAGTLLGPAGVFTNGLLLATVVEAGRHRRAAAMSRVVLAAAVSAGAVMVTMGAVLRLVPHAWGVVLLGDSWAGASHVAPPLSLAFAGTAVATVVAAGMRGSGRTRESVRLVTALAAGVLLCGAFASGRGAAVTAAAMAVPAWVGALVTIARWRRGHPSTVEPDPKHSSTDLEPAT